MGKSLKVTIDDILREKTNTFIDRIDSKMQYKSEYRGKAIRLDWIDEVEFACPYIDNLVRNPRVALITEEDIVKIEKAKKVSVASIKDLAKNSQRIDKFDSVTNKVQPSKLLIERREETFNTYENRFLFTVIKFTIRFVVERERELKNLEVQNEEELEYAASTVTGEEKVNIKLKVTSNDIAQNQNNEDDNIDFSEIKERLRIIKDYFINWSRSEFMETMEKAKVSFVTPPIKKTNLILKNPNFQVVTRLWEYINKYDMEKDEGSLPHFETAGNTFLKEFLDDAFLINYIVMDSINKNQKEQHERLTKYAVVLIAHQVQRVLSLLLKNGVEISDEEIISLISAEIKNVKSRRTIDNSEIKQKFQKAMEEYIERTQEYL